jgi:hypothetical protein
MYVLSYHCRGSLKVKLQYLIAALAIVTNAVGMPGRAATIYDTLSGGFQCCVSWNVNPSFIPSAQFTSPGNFAVTQISVALDYNSGTDSATVSVLTADQNGAPGTVLGSWSVSGQVASGTSPPTTISGISGVALFAGQNYFLRVSPGDASTVDSWKLSDCCGGTLYNGQTLAYANTNAPAYSVIGDVYVANPDIYNAGVLSIPTLTIGTETYADVVVTVGSIISGPIIGSTPLGTADSFDTTKQLLTIPTVKVGTTDYFNVVVKVSDVVSIGSVTGADSFDGTYLTIPNVQVLGGSAYKNAVVTVKSIDRVAGGMPMLAQDEYIRETNQLIIPTVQANGKVYTNVVVTVGEILSVGP